MISAPVRPTRQRRCAVRADPLGLRKLRRSVTRLNAQVALRFAPLRRWRSLHWHGAPPAIAGRVAWHAVQRSASRVSKFGARPRVPVKGARLHNAAQSENASCPCGEADAQKQERLSSRFLLFHNCDIAGFDDIFLEERYYGVTMRRRAVVACDEN
jgi:hypothetical protein